MGTYLENSGLQGGAALGAAILNGFDDSQAGTLSALGGTIGAAIGGLAGAAIGGTVGYVISGLVQASEDNSAPSNGKQN